MKRENPRTDIASRKRFDRVELLRLVKVGSKVLVDKEGNLPGRGVYLKKDLASLELALKKKAFERAFRRPLNEEEISSIKEAL